jgi:hypothetical protein
MAAERPRVRESVFLGGPGQSGVSTLSSFLGQHPRVLALPLETCFIVANNGLLDIVRAVSEEYDSFRLDAMLHAFDRLMHHDLCSPRSHPYDRFDLAAFFGRQRYHASVEQFFTELGVRRYPGVGLSTGPVARFGRFHLPHKFRQLRLPAWLAAERTYLYYSELRTRAQALSASRHLVDGLFMSAARSAGQSVWCEQTTTNQQFADFLVELYPDGLYIDVRRDPLDVALAHTAQNWAPRDFELVLRNIRARYTRWFEVRRKLRATSYLEVRFEELISEPERVLRGVCAAIGVAYDSRMLERRPDPARLAQERARRQAADLESYRRILGGVAEELGYPVP